MDAVMPMAARVPRYLYSSGCWRLALAGSAEGRCMTGGAYHHPPASGETDARGRPRFLPECSQNE